MQMTYEQYIQNPMGVANSVISNREMYRTLYTKKLDDILVRELSNENRMYHRLYKDKDRYIAYLKIPSEVVPGFYYDTVIEFTPPKGPKAAIDSTLKSYHVRFYSNDPSFVFTFAHAFIKNDIFFKDLTSKMSKEAVQHRAVEKNPKEIVGYVKSLYFAYIIMNRLGLFVKAKYTETYNQSALLARITEADVMIDRRQKGEVKYRKEKREEAKNEERLRKDTKPIEDNLATKAIRHANRVANTKITPVIKPVTNSKVIKTVNKVKKTKKGR